ncbi:MAG: hypothetical protein KAU90_10975 [Sulfurovaceae bacterium]|nr:hypothetical protein [Sulfurovaceae bacterium]
MQTSIYIIVEERLERAKSITVERRALGAKNPPTKFTKKRYKIMYKILSKNGSTNSSSSKSKIIEEVSLEII